MAEQQTVLQQLQTSVTRFQQNEERVNVFTNDPDSVGFYTTNLEPSKEIETLPHLMGRLKDRYLTVFFQGPWGPGAQYSLNDVVQGPDGAFWLVVGPYVSGDSIEDDIADRRLIPYGASPAAAEENIRWAWAESNSVEAGEILTLPRSYLPGRNSLLLFYLNTVCVPRKPESELISGQYQYEEIEIVPGSPSNQVRIFFPVAAGDVLDMFVASSQMSEAIEKAREAAAAAGTLAGAAETAAGQAEAAQAGAAAAAALAGTQAGRAESEADRANTEAERLLGGFDASLIASGTIGLDRLPASAVQRLVEVDTEAERFLLTPDDVQDYDTVKVLATGIMYRVVDETRLDEPAGYKEYSAGRAAAVDWSGVENKPDSFLTHEEQQRLAGLEQGAQADAAAATTTLSAALAANADFTVPSYRVGSNKLQVFLNSAHCAAGAGNQYQEVGAAGADSTTIQFFDALETGWTVSAVVLP